MDTIKDILKCWFTGIMKILIPIFIALILTLIACNTGNPEGRYYDYGSTIDIQ
jgi:hypothetical protein